MINFSYPYFIQQKYFPLNIYYFKSKKLYTYLSTIFEGYTLDFLQPCFLKCQYLCYNYIIATNKRKVSIKENKCFNCIK